MKKKVLHLISGLGEGGAEGVLYRLCTNSKKFEHIVISMTDAGKYGPLLERKGVDVFCLNMFSLPRLAVGCIKLIKILLQSKPDVVQTWMYHADFFGILARVFGFKLVWNVRNTDPKRLSGGLALKLLPHLCAFFSFVPSIIIFCAYKAKNVHIQMGYSARKAAVVHNGYDGNIFKPSPDAPVRFRVDYSVPECVPIIGMVARFNKQKDHENLIAALSRLKLLGREFRCYLIGGSTPKEKARVSGLIQKYELADHVFVLGGKNDVPYFMSAMDIHVLSSKVEGFPNVLAEAMLCGTPSVSTNVGDAAVIIGKEGWVVPPSEPDKLCDALADAIDQYNGNSWENLCEVCRKRMLGEFSIDTMVGNYENVWEHLSVS